MFGPAVEGAVAETTSISVLDSSAYMFASGVCSAVLW